MTNREIAEKDKEKAYEFTDEYGDEVPCGLYPSEREDLMLIFKRAIEYGREQSLNERQVPSEEEIQAEYIARQERTWDRTGELFGREFITGARWAIERMK